MNAKELRQAAEITRHFIAREDDDLNVIAGHIENIAAHILSTVRDDDDEQYSQQWAEDVTGETKIYLGNGFYIDLTDGSIVIDVELTIGNYVDHTSGKIKTRGQFRSLCRGLGIELKEVNRAEQK